MLDEPETIIDGEMRALWEPLPTSPIRLGHRQRRRQRRRAVLMLLNPEQRMEHLLSGALAEQLQGIPPTRALQASITQRLIDLFWTTLPEQDDRWLRATNIAHAIAEAVMRELAPLEREEVEPFSSDDEIH